MSSDFVDGDLYRGLAVKYDALRAEGVVLRSDNHQAMRVAAEALGTDEEYQTLAGCVSALAIWSVALRAERDALKESLHRFRTAHLEATSRIRELEAEVERLKRQHDG